MDIDNELGVTNHESLTYDANSNGFLEIGDTMRGTMRVDSITGNTSYWSNFSGNFEE